MNTTHKYTSIVPESRTISFLSDRLKKRVVLPNLEEPEKSPYGTPATYVNLVADHLTDSFDFSTVKEGLCMFDHFKTVIGTFKCLKFMKKAMQSICLTFVLIYREYSNFQKLGGGGGGQPEKRRKKTMSILGFYMGGSSFFDLNFIWV